MFNHPFSFQGRIRRTEFGLTFIIYAIAYGIIAAIGASGGAAGIIFILVIPLIWFLWAQGAKRCHDVGHSGWWQVIPFYVFWMLFQEGQPGLNEYGENPKGMSATGDLTILDDSFTGTTSRKSSDNPSPSDADTTNPPS
ncbi:MAG: hypothetical protein JWN78_3045 [Bacteroidota bacterium]|nr:hypothetical protein [Bacteroidota bacterium]